MPRICKPGVASGLIGVIMAVGLALPASAQVTYSLDSRFGVTYERDSTTGESRMRPGGNALLTMRLNHQFDNGLRVQLAVGIDAGNLANRGYGHGFGHGHRPGRGPLHLPGSQLR
ncbi:MAG: hypothetical protein ACXIVG_04260 [Pararhodobacter sp.]